MDFWFMVAWDSVLSMLTYLMIDTSFNCCWLYNYYMYNGKHWFHEYANRFNPLIIKKYISRYIYDSVASNHGTQNYVALC